MSYPPLLVTTATRADAAEILALQKLAYRSEAELYGDFSIPPMLQTLSGMEEDLAQQVVLKATVGERIVGSVRAYRKDATVFIGRLIVQPDVQGRGYGKQLMHAIEASFPGASRFELFTGDRSERNLGLYRKLGYRDFKVEALTPAIRFVYLEKPAS
jgi:ribosomal protein S18 acetylase RimI-like enzyme